MNLEEVMLLVNSMDLKIKAMCETLDNKINILNKRVDKLWEAIENKQ